MKQTEVLIIGAGIAGLVCAYECLQQGLRVTILEREGEDRIGGLARWAFGGMALVDTPLQRKNNIKDSAELAWRDWCNFAEYEAQTTFEQAWGHYYVEHSRREVYDYLLSKGLKFLPAVAWVERGLYGAGNSVPRYHVLWGTGKKLVDCFLELLLPYRQGGQLEIVHGHTCTEISQSKDGVQGCVTRSKSGEKESWHAKVTVVATGGVNGSLEQVRKNMPHVCEELLNGAHPSADGLVHEGVAKLGGKLVHLDKMWNYAAGIPHPKPHFPGHGLSLVPSKSALWLDHRGERIGPEPLVTGFDTHALCERITQLEYPYTWQVLNLRIALKEIAVSGSEHNPSIRDQRLLRFLKETLFGNHALIQQLLNESDHVISAESLPELVAAMNRLNGNQLVELAKVEQSILGYDAMVARGPRFWNDDQLRRIQHARAWKPDRLRTCSPKPILSPGHGPLIAIKLRLITRKSLGGIQTDLSSQVMDVAGQNMKGLYAIGEAAGFGGGGASGKRSLEGTFLSGCIMTAQSAARSITNT